MTLTQPSVRHPLLASALCCLLIRAAAADMGAWTKGLEGNSVPLAEAILVAGCVLGALSILLLLAALLDVTGIVMKPRCCGDAVCNDYAYPIMHCVLATLWLPVIAIAAFLLSKQHYAAIAFVAAGGIFVMLHVATALTQLCWWCCGAPSMGLSDHPKSALLTAQSGDQNRFGNGGSNPAGGGGLPLEGGELGAAGHNPLRGTYGLRLGSSYHIFINDEESQPYTGLQGGPHRPRGPSRQKVQPLISLQSGPLHQSSEQPAGTGGKDDHVRV